MSYSFLDSLFSLVEYYVVLSADGLFSLMEWGASNGKWWFVAGGFSLFLFLGAGIYRSYDR